MIAVGGRLALISIFTNLASAPPLAWGGQPGREHTNFCSEGRFCERD
jgi:hypothetical protein